MSGKLKIVSLNVRGMRNHVKRRKIFRFVKQKHKADIIMLQETHGDTNSEKIWSSEYGNRIIFAHGTNNSKGVAIALNKKTANSVDKICRDMYGRYILIVCKIEGLTYCICNIYAPNTDNAEWYEEIMDLVKQQDCIFNILGGDFNLVLNCETDRKSQQVYHPNAQKVVMNTLDDMELVDIWRQKNNDKKVFTWMNKEGNWSRIDYFLISESLNPRCMEATIEPSICTDHSLITLSIDTSLSKRGPGVWKFNNELLNDTHFTEEMHKVIQGTKRISEHMSDTDAWELMKFETMLFARSYAKERATNEKLDQLNLYAALSSMQEEITKSDLVNPDLLRNIENIQIELDSYATRDAKRAAFRCKQKWADSGEKCTKYFFNLEKRNNLSKSMYVTRRADGSLTKDYTEILDLQTQFFSDLYRSDTRVVFNVHNDTDLRLTPELQEKFEMEVTQDELFDAMMTLKPNKTPGGDGMTLEFLRKFWKELVTPLHKMLMESVIRGKLNPTGRHALLNLILKKGCDEFELRNWRAISLLNYDYKIWSKVIANRLEEATHLIGKEQTGFIKGRSLFTNIKKTMEIVGHAKRQNNPGIIIIIDFEKCFDRIEYASIEGVFKFFGFGNGFINMLFLLFRDFKMRTQSNGFTSRYFSKTRGVNQGCCASPLIYSFCSAIIQHIIYSNRLIKGLELHGIHNLLSQFADDTAAFLSYEKIVLDEFTKELLRIEATMGLKVSYDKTTIYRIGSLLNTNAELYTQKNYKWSDGPIDTLGVKIMGDGTGYPSSFDEVMTKLTRTCETWYNRQLSLSGKCLVVNTLMGSLFVYKMTTMTDMSEDQIKRVENTIRNFIWSGKSPKIALSTLQKDKTQGGTRLVNIRAKQDALKIGWFYKIDTDPMLSECVYNELDIHLRNIIWRCNLSPKDSAKHFGKDSFWKQLLFAWGKINFKEPMNKESILEQIIWLNTFIKCGEEMLSWKSWIDKDILTIRDLWNGEQLCFKSYQELDVEWFNLLKIATAIPNDWKDMLKYSNDTEKAKPSTYNMLLTSKNITRQVYNMLIYDEHALHKYYLRWVDRARENLSYECYCNSFNRMYSCTKVTKLRDFYYRLLLGKIVLNVDTKEWDITASDTCTLCEKEPETLTHLFWDCEETQYLVQTLREICEINSIEAVITKYSFIFNTLHNNRFHIVNFIGILMKQFIYKNRCLKKKISIIAFLKELEQNYLIESANAHRSNRIPAFTKRWSPITVSYC